MAKLTLDYLKNSSIEFDSSNKIEKELLLRTENKMDYCLPNDSYPFLYAFSKERESVLNWYSFKKNCSILEVNSEYGSLTSLFLKKADKVISVESNYNKALINYERNKENENLEIIIGDLLNIKLNEKFDYVVVNGINKDNTNVINAVKELLKANGNILLIADNRIGIDRFYNVDESLLSRKELIELISNNDLKIGKWYYPFPNTIFAKELFTDKSINTILPKSINTFISGTKYYLNNNLDVYKNYMSNGIAQEFANSFIIELGECNNDIEYIKLNDSYTEDKSVTIKELADILNNEKDLNYKCSELIDKNEQLIEDNKNLSYNLQAVKNALFWKISSPLRNLIDRYKENKNNKQEEVSKKRVDDLLNNDVYFNNYNDLFFYLDKCGISYYNLDQNILNELNSANRRLLFITHELTLTGAPNALFNFALARLQRNEKVVFISLKDGELRELLKANNIPVIIFKEANETTLIKHISSIFDLVISNTTETCGIINKLLNTNIPVLWWVHEAKASYHEWVINNLPNSVSENIKICCVNDYAKDRLMEYRPNYHTENLYYYTQDFEKICLNKNQYEEFNDKYVFLMVGVQEKRKRQDLLAEAILQLDKNTVEKCEFVFVGKKMHKPIELKIDQAINKYPDNVMYIEKMVPSELADLYKKADYIVCVSDDDPLPMVVSEAFSLGKQIIASNSIGQAKIIKDNDIGYVLDKADSLELSNLIENIVNNDLRIKYNQNARKVFDELFSKESFITNTDKLLDECINYNKTQKEVSVSIVIPTYNPIEYIDSLLSSLKSQKNIDKLEIVVVDSDSTDGSLEIIKKHNCKLIQIDKNEFSHSYARNLGASNAGNEIIVFMTQDAMPSSNEWLYQMIEPIIKHEVVAVCGKEECSKDIDVFYRCQSYIHSNVMGFDKEDKLSYYSPVAKEMTLRKNANLRDIACPIRKEIFDLFKYRFDYAEDLDLGLRLIKKGYKIKFLHYPTTLHGHNRNVDYYFRRSFVEGVAFEKIFERDLSSDVYEISFDICYSYYALNKIIEILKESNLTDFELIKSKFDECVSNVATESVEEKYSGNSVLDDCIKKLSNYISVESSKSLSILKELSIYLNEPFTQFIIDNNITNIKTTQVCESLLKQYACIVGTKLSSINKSTFIFNYIDKNGKGI